MEKNFYTDNFEQFLKENADNFRMYPSKRVWHSIYNDLHPSRKWPSLAVWLFIISAVIFVGLSNRNLLATAELAASGNSNGSTLHLPALAGKNENKTSTSISPANKSYNLDAPGTNSEAAISSNTGNPVPSINNGNNNSTVGNISEETNADGVSTLPSSVSNVASSNLEKSSSTTMTFTGVDAEDDSNEKVPADAITIERKALKSISIKTETPAADQPAANNLALVEKPKAILSNNAIPATNKNNAEREWIEDFAFHNKPYSSKWKSRTTYQLYITPSVGYRILSKTTNYIPASSGFAAPASTNTQDYEDALNQSAAVNMELGGNVLYNISKKWNLKVGIQLNYSNYTINAYELKHPTVTTVLLKDRAGFPQLDPRSTTLANVSGLSTKKLNSNSYQVSLPLGADFKLAGWKNLKWYAGATIQPTFIAGGNSYLISSDLKNYVEDNTFTNNWNLNAGVETFLSYKTPSGIIVNAGPQFRYQLFSTYNKQYSYSEKLYNLGLKIGITTRF